MLKFSRCVSGIAMTLAVLCTSFPAFGQTDSPTGGIVAISIFIPGISGAPGDVVHLRPAILVSPVTNLTIPFGYTLTFDRSLLSPVGSALSVATGNLRTLTIYDTMINGVPRSSPISFIVGLGSNDSTILIPANFTMAGFSGQVVYTNGIFRLANICQSGGTRLFDQTAQVSLAAPHPNPAPSIAKIDFQIAEAGRTTLVLFDAFGRSIKTLFDQDAEPGSYSVELPTTTFAEGIYFYSLQTPSQRLINKLRIER